MMDYLNKLKLYKLKLYEEFIPSNICTAHVIIIWFLFLMVPLITLEAL